MKLIVLIIFWAHIMKISCSDSLDEQENEAINSYILHHPSILRAVLNSINSFDEENKQMRPLTSFDYLRNDKRGARLPIDGYIMGKR